MSAQDPPNVNLKDDLGGAIIRPAIAVVVVVAFFVAARLVSRKLKKADWNASELFVVISFVGCLIFAALDVYGKLWCSAMRYLACLCLSRGEDAKLGLGKHIEVVPIPRVKKIFLVRPLPSPIIHTTHGSAERLCAGNRVHYYYRVYQDIDPSSV